MSSAIRATGYGVVLALMGASASMNFAYGTTISPGKLGIAFGLVFFLLDILKSLLPVRASAFFRHGESAKGIAAWVISIALSGLALTSGHALYLTTVGEGAGDVAQAQERYSLAREAKKQLEDELARIGQTRPSGEIKSEMEAKKLDKLYGRSKQCTDVTAADSRALCQGISKLEGELSIAKQAESLRADLKTASAKLASLDISKANQAQNVQGELSGWLAFAIPLLLELGCVFGLWFMETAPKLAVFSEETISAGTADAEISSEKTPQFPDECAVTKWADSHLKRKAGNDILAADLYPIYAAYCEREGLKALHKNGLGRKLKELGFATNKRGGKVRYANVVLKARVSKPRLVA
jgi:hypothetical protein